MRKFQPEEHEPLWYVLVQLIRPLLKAHPLPWKVEHDWTKEVHDADSAIVMKFMLPAHAALFISLAEEIAQEDEDWERKLGKLCPELAV
ncbi:MAG TPA: hypothetical protein VFY28_01200 [Candidatus Paceibacterota bacterium]|nr:hypothetical protein [Candidatus Paceibacterota bacterium]